MKTLIIPFFSKTGSEFVHENTFVRVLHCTKKHDGYHTTVAESDGATLPYLVREALAGLNASARDHAKKPCFQPETIEA